jgi:hypothetical protein
MLKANVMDPAMMQFVRSIKEMEGLVRQAHQTHAEKRGCRVHEIDIPEQWHSVFHMARVAPALLSCLKECVGVIEDELLEGEEGDPRDALLCLLESCDAVLTVADGGARDSNQVLH